MSLMAKRTGTLVKFADIMIGCAFYYGGRFYTRSSYERASEIVSTGNHGRVGNFMHEDMANELVETVEVVAN